LQTRIKSQREIVKGGGGEEGEEEEEVGVVVAEMIAQM